jgi:hypothetical protein
MVMLCYAASATAYAACEAYQLHIAAAVLVLYTVWSMFRTVK